MISAKEIRDLPLMSVLTHLGMSIKADLHFKPTLNADTKRLHIADDRSNYVYELVLTGQRWFDLRQGKGGGGAIDLVIHLKACTVRQAIDLLMPLTKKIAPGNPRHGGLKD